MLTFSAVCPSITTSAQTLVWLHAPTPVEASLRTQCCEEMNRPFITLQRRNKTFAKWQGVRLLCTHVHECISEDRPYIKQAEKIQKFEFKTNP